MTASFFLSLSACQARSAKREEGGYIFLVVFAVCGAILPFLPRKKPQRDPFSLDIRGKKIPTGLPPITFNHFLQIPFPHPFLTNRKWQKLPEMASITFGHVLLDSLLPL